MVNDFYIKDIRTFPDPKAEPSVMEGLPLNRQKKCLRFVQAEDRKRSLCAGIIINDILNKHNCKEIPDEGINGKPYIEGIHFNVSHSGNYVIGVCADTPVGCDIEKMEAAPLDIADNYFYNTEKDYIFSHSDNEYAFWKMWTLKESYMKMTGEGMKLKLDSFCIVPGEKLTVYRDGVKQKCVFKHFVYDKHSIAICETVL